MVFYQSNQKANLSICLRTYDHQMKHYSLVWCGNIVEIGWKIMVDFCLSSIYYGEYGTQNIFLNYL